jgi:hypothetical protein
MEQLSSAVLSIETELANKNKEIEYLKKKLSEMYTLDQVVNIHYHNRYMKKKLIHPTNAALRYMFDKVCRKN